MTSIEPLLIAAKKAGVSLRSAADAQLQNMLQHLSELLLQRRGELLAANAEDVARQDAADPRTDRLLLNAQRVTSIASAIRNISHLPNPAKVLEQRTLPNGLRLQKWAVPLGVVGAIYESRPNVTFDIAALCIRSGNACVLKGSREAEATNKAAVAIIQEALKQYNVDAACITLLPAERAVVHELYKATRYVDVLIPRGSDSLIQAVRKDSMIPVIETGAGVCHVYVHQNADINKAVAIVVNAKTSRPSVCNAMDTVLVDEGIAASFFKKLQQPFKEKAVVVYGDEKSTALLHDYPFVEKASDEDFDREFLDMKCAAKIVSGLDEALEHIAQHSTRHSEAIVSEDAATCSRFVQEVDAAAVYTNASTRFTDGEEFGLGAEIGISTQKLHARGPFALEKLVTEKWVIEGNGQVR